MKMTLLASLLSIGLGTSFAATTSELELSNAAGSVTCTIAASGNTGTGGGCAGITGTTSVGPSGIAITFGTFTNGSTVWSINVVEGVSNTPGTDPGIDVSSETAVCKSGFTANTALDIYFSDIGFTGSGSSFTNGFSATDTGSGTAAQKAWVSSTDTLMAQTSSIGEVGPFSGAGTFQGSVSGGSATVPYSMTLEQIFTTDAQNDTFSVDGNIAGTPEPAALILFGTVLAFCSSKLSRRRKS
jgi:hypothetical protein